MLIRAVIFTTWMHTQSIFSHSLKFLFALLVLNKMHFTAGKFQFVSLLKCKWTKFYHWTCTRPKIRALS